MTEPIDPATGAESVLIGLRACGVEYLFANAGTDFPPIIEAFATLPAQAVPVPVTVPHETASVAMAHGYYLVTGRPQAVMVHVNVGLANAVMGVINAASDNIPVLVMSGRTPITERGRKGSRATVIQYGQEMFDQTSLVRDLVKYNYEMRYPEQGAPLVARALAVAQSEPKGPAYLSLPREPLSATIPDAARVPVAAVPPASASQPDPAEIAKAAGLLARAETPVILCQRGDIGGRLARALSSFAGRHGIAVADPYSIRNVLASSDPMFIGYDPKAAVAGADVILVLDCGIPWIESTHAPPPETAVIHIGPDPLFARMPVRGYKTDLAIQSDPVAAIEALDAAMPAPKDSGRRDMVAARAEDRRTAARKKAETGTGAPMSAEWFSRCVSDAMDDTAIAFAELGAMAGMMDLKGPNRLFAHAHSGGLGWAFPAALGAQLADRDRLVIATMGDGSYIFSNPTSCHQIAEALALPVLVVIKNNGMWNAVRRSVINGYPGGRAAQANTMPLTSLEPSPDYLKVAEASRAHVERVEAGSDLPAALARAIKVIREERRQALIDCRVAVSDFH